MKCGKSTVGEKIARFARQCVRFHWQQLVKARLTGDVLFDGVRSYEGSKYAAYDLNVAIHRKSSCVLGISEAALRRSGRLRPDQRAKRAQLEALHGLPSGRETRQSIAELLVAIGVALDKDHVQFITDKHTAYPPGIRDAGFAGVPHKTVSSRKHRDFRNELFEINLTDNLIRHTQSSQTRKTIALNKRRQAGVERAWLFLLQRNYLHQRRVSGGPETPAMLAGIASRSMTWEDIFERRVLPHEVQLPPVWERHVSRGIITRAFARNARHENKRAS